MQKTLYKIAWTAIVFGTLMFFLGAAMAFSLNFTGSWQPNTWRLVTDQPAITQFLVFFIFNSDFWGVLLALVGIVFVGAGFLLLKNRRIALHVLTPVAWAFLALSVVFGIGLIVFGQTFMADNPFRFMTPSINKGVLGILTILGLVVVFVSGVPWALFLYFLRRDK